MEKDTTKEVEEIREEEKANTENEEPNMSEVVKGFRTVKLSRYGEVVLYRPNFYVVEGGDKLASAAKRRMLLDDKEPMPTESELKKIYERRGDWTEADEARMDFLSKNIIQIIREQRAGVDDRLGVWIPEDRKDIAKARDKVLAAGEDNEAELEVYSKLRNEYLAAVRDEHGKLRDTHQELFSGTIDAFANYERQLYYCVKCFKREVGGEPVWEDLDALKNEDMYIMQEAMTAASKFWAGLDNEEMESFFDALQGGEISG